MNEFEKKAIVNQLRSSNLRHIYKIDKDYYENEFLFLFEYNGVYLSIHERLLDTTDSLEENLSIIKNAIDDEVKYFDNVNKDMKSASWFNVSSHKEKVFKKCVDQLKLLRLIFDFDLELLRDYNSIKSIVSNGFDEKRDFVSILESVLKFYNCDKESLALISKGQKQLIVLD